MPSYIKRRSFIYQFNNNFSGITIKNCIVSIAHFVKFNFSIFDITLYFTTITKISKSNIRAVKMDFTIKVCCAKICVKQITLVERNNCIWGKFTMKKFFLEKTAVFESNIVFKNYMIELYIIPVFIPKYFVFICLVFLLYKTVMVSAMLKPIVTTQIWTT